MNLPNCLSRNIEDPREIAQPSKHDWLRQKPERKISRWKNNAIAHPSDRQV
ncbi:hypothetical protein PMH09_17330 [Roseofilum sp. BLCC_M143]|uniref:Uncharacterized protein n=1 Tax=Roseofilum casamattae BLCC-M143 TaxID=3022442 RepID=A0ABT7C0H2_9CYAN|nr:hypothetical protein [Roseofilum casamattae BLCC-M143]